MSGLLSRLLEDTSGIRLLLFNYKLLGPSWRTQLARCDKPWNKSKHPQYYQWPAYLFQKRNEAFFCPSSWDGSTMGAFKNTIGDILSTSTTISHKLSVSFVIFSFYVRIHKKSRQQIYVVFLIRPPIFDLNYVNQKQLLPRLSAFPLCHKVF